MSTNKRSGSKTIDEGTNIVSQFLSSRPIDSGANKLGRLAINQSLYFDLEGIKLRATRFGKSLSSYTLGRGYDKAIDSIKPDLSWFDKILESALHNKTIERATWLVNGLLLNSTVIFTTLAVSLIGIVAYSALCLALTDLYPDPIVLLLIYVLSSVVGIIARLLSSKK